MNDYQPKSVGNSNFRHWKFKRTFFGATVFFLNHTKGERNEENTVLENVACLKCIKLMEFRQGKSLYCEFSDIKSFLIKKIEKYENIR